MSIGQATDTGVLVGADPRTPPPAPTPVQSFTQEDLERARSQEKNKLHTKLEAMEAELERLKVEREKREAEEAQHRADAEAQAAAADEAARKEAEAALDVRSLLEKKEQEWDAKFRQAESDRAAAEALLRREQEYREVMDYRAQAIAANQDTIMDHLRDMVTGNTPEEIDASIAVLAAKSSAILEDAQAALTGARAAQRGTSVTGMPSGSPLDTSSGQSPYSADDIAGMSMTEYIKNRDKLLSQSRSDRGLFG